MKTQWRKLLRWEKRIEKAPRDLVRVMGTVFAVSVLVGMSISYLTTKWKTETSPNISENTRQWEQQLMQKRVEWIKDQYYASLSPN